MAFRKQTHADFRRRIKRVDPVYYRWGHGGARRDTTASRPLGSALLGFFIAYITISIASNRSYLQASLKQGSLSPEYHDAIFGMLAVLVTVASIALALHVIRFFIKSGGKKRNSGGILIGTLGALMLVYTPASVWQTGFGLMDDTSRALLLTASARVEDALPDVDLAGVTMVTSFSR